MPAQPFARLSGPVQLTTSLLLALAAALPAQNATTVKTQSTPTELQRGILLFPEAFVSNYWTHTARVVNAPANVSKANPGQCIRIGLAATGDKRDELIAQTRLAFHVRFAGNTQDFPTESFAETRPIKPEGGDFVTEALAAANIQNPLLSMATLGVSAANWCVPTGAQDGEAIIEAEAITPTETTKLVTTRLKIESFATGSHHAFKDLGEQNNWMMNYYRRPEPARLLPALHALVADHSALSNQNALLNAVAFFSNVLKNNPLAAKEFATQIGAEKNPAQIIGIGMLRESGFDIQSLVQNLSPEERKSLAKPSDLPNAYVFNPTDRQDPTRLDFCWAEFLATGRIEPIRQIVSALGWRADFDTFDKARKAGTLRKEWTPELSHAVTYMAAGWSLSSFKRNDPLVADYIQAIAADPTTAAAVQAELKGLDTNPAFRQTKEK